MAGPPLDDSEEDDSDEDYYDYYDDSAWDNQHTGPVIYYGCGSDGGCDCYGDVSYADSGSVAPLLSQTALPCQVLSGEASDYPQVIVILPKGRDNYERHGQKGAAERQGLRRKFTREKRRPKGRDKQKESDSEFEAIYPSRGGAGDSEQARWGDGDGGGSSDCGGGWWGRQQ